MASLRRKRARTRWCSHHRRRSPLRTWAARRTRTTSNTRAGRSRYALLAVAVPFVEVHLTDVASREPARRQLLFADLALAVITGKGAEGYRLALEALCRHLGAR